MIDGGVVAHVTCVDPSRLDRSLAGRRFDGSFLADLPAGADPCGENSEFHTFDIDDKEITTRVNHRGKDRPQTIVFDPQWAMIDNSVWKYRPGIMGIRMPLHVGKQWRGESNASNIQKGIALRRSDVAKVVGQEKVTTPAGSFDTYRIEVSGQEVNTRDQTKISKATNVFWYAPQINRWVKRTLEVRFEGRIRDSLVEELTEYSRKP